MHMQTKEPEIKSQINIFVDLDETLIHTNTSTEPNEIPEISINTSTRPGKPDYYSSSLRPGAIELLAELRRIGNVFMLTRATHEYAVAMNKVFDLGFPVNRIYSRRDVKNFRYKELNLPQGKNFLIDDLPQIDNYEKITLISQLGLVKYIHIKPFYGFISDVLLASDIENIVGTIKNT